MSVFEFDGDEDDMDEYYLVAEEGTVDSSGYGMFIDPFYKAQNTYYTQASRYNSRQEAERVKEDTERRNGNTCVIIEITH